MVGTTTTQLGHHLNMVHRRPISPYKRATLKLVEGQLAPMPPVPRALDFGSGDGWYGYQLQSSGRVGEVVGVDVKERPDSWIKPQLYGGEKLPFRDREFPLVMAIDVLHHCPNPLDALNELLRCASDWVLIKDHTFRSQLGRLTLMGLDHIGNTLQGIPSIYRYQREFDWFATAEAAGFHRQSLLHPAEVEPRFWGRWTNQLQWIGVWRRCP